MGRLLRRLLRASLTFHLLLPLLGTVLVGSAWGMLSHHIYDLRSFRSYWTSARLLDVVGIYFSYTVVLIVLIYQQTSTRIANLSALRDILPSATSYFAVSATPLAVWFDPANQEYLATIAAAAIRTPAMVHQRVMLFFTENQLADAHASFLDEHYAKTFAAIHAVFGIPLGYLGPNGLRTIIRDTPIGDLRTMRLVPKPIAWLPDGLAKWFVGTARLVRRQGLAFALVETAASGDSVLLFDRKRAVLDIHHVTDSASVRCYKRLVASIGSTVYKPGSREFRKTHDFAERLRG